MGRRYIVKQRARIDTITGPVNLPYGTTVEAVEDYLIHQRRQLCTVASRKAHLYFARDDDGKGDVYKRQSYTRLIFATAWVVRLFW